MPTRSHFLPHYAPFRLIYLSSNRTGTYKIEYSTTITPGKWTSICRWLTLSGLPHNKPTLAIRSLLLWTAEEWLFIQGQRYDYLPSLCTWAPSAVYEPLWLVCLWSRKVILDPLDLFGKVITFYSCIPRVIRHYLLKEITTAWRYNMSCLLDHEV